MTMPFYGEDLPEDFEDFEDFESDESDEATRGRRYRSVPVGRPSRPSITRPAGNYVTQVQLQAALADVRRQIGTNAAAIKTLEGRINTLTQEQTRLRRDVSEQKKQTDGLRKELRQTREMAGLMPLLMQPKAVALTSEAGGLRQGTKVVVDDGDSFSMMLPLLLFSGSGLTGGGGEGNDNSMMMMMLALSLGKRSS